MWEDEWDSGLPAHAGIQVWVTENPVVGQILGPDGRVLVEVREREPIGFRPRKRAG